MEEKRREAGNLPGNSIESTSSEPASSRRRGGAHKRKASSLGGANSSSTPSKRVTREKSVLSHPLNHNGPFTRARVSPNNVAGTASAYGAGGLLTSERSVKAEGSVFLSEVQRGEAAEAAAEELNKMSKLANLETSFEAGFEAIKSRSANAHVVPNHCGWFSWTKIHPIEERTMASFFSGKSGTLNPDMYLEIRNSIVKKFHANPSVLIELKDLSELEVGGLDARQEVMEFLDHWGLINFHPFLPTESTSASEGDVENKKNDSIVEKLFHFETLDSCLSVAPKANHTTTAAPPGLLPDSAIYEEMVRPEGPAVDYHCNSCSADCSRKRYHCQKQADFDLCSECFNNGKFDSDMSSSDFILMEHAEVPGVSSGKWTDQETLLLLEALELYKENWNEIAEHVATKTKAQCILHFIQMPIEDSFLESEADIEVGLKESVVSPIENDSSVPSGTPELVNKTAPEDGMSMVSNEETTEKDDKGEVKVGEDNSKQGDVELKAGLDNSKQEDGAEEIAEDIAVNALRDAFEAIGYVITPEHPLSFADVGNPVMALASFLARLVGSDVANASAHFSLKSLSGKSPGLELATRHCFLLEDPPDEKEQANSESIVDVEAEKNENQLCIKQKQDNSTSVLDDIALSTTGNNEKHKVSATDESTVAISTNGKSSDAIIEQETVVRQGVDASSKSELAKDEKTDVVKETENMELKSTTNSIEKLGEESNIEKPSQSTGTLKDVDLSDVQQVEGTETQKLVLSSSTEISKQADDTSNPLISANNEPRLITDANSVKEGASSDVAMVTDEPSQTEMSDSTVGQGVSRVPSDSLPSTETAMPHPVKSNSMNGPEAADNQSNDDKKENSNCTVKKDVKIDKLKRAAVTALSAAAVKAKLLANQEEDQIRHLAMILIDKQLHKLESKLAFFNEMDNVTMRVREQLDRSKQRLFQERAQIIASRLGLPGSARAMPPTLPNRMAVNSGNPVPRPPPSMASQRPPISRPVGMANPNPNPNPNPNLNPNPNPSPQYITSNATMSGS